MFAFILSSCGTSQSKQTTDENKNELPEWVNNYKNDYPDMLYLSSLGVSEYKGIAEKQAYEGIASSFEVHVKSVQDSKQVTTEDSDSFSQTYSEVQNINTSTNQSLINIKTSESYYDNKSGKYYILATLHKSTTASMYIQKRDDLVNNAESMYSKSLNENDPLTKIALISNSIVKLKEVDEIDDKLKVLDNSSMGYTKFKSIHELVLEREKILDRIPVFIDESDDKIYNQLKKEFSNLGFKISKTKENTFLAIDYSLKIENSEIKNQTAKFVLWNLDVNLTQNEKNHTFGTYTSKGRSSQLNFGAAKERAYFDIGKKLDLEFKPFLIEKILKIQE